MNIELKDVLYRNLSQVFEKMFFTALVPCPDTEPEMAPSGEYLEAVISYRGGREGTIRIYMPLALVRGITQNFLGVEGELLTENQILDMARETTNMAVGSLLGELDPKGSCRLGIPSCRRCGDLSDAAPGIEGGAYLFSSEQGILWLVMEESETGNS